MSASDESSTPKLHIDADWKAEAQAEKARLAEKEAKTARDATSGEQLPDANFGTLVDSLAYQALSGLGIFADKASGGVVVDLPGSKFAIDLLQVLQDKTKGNVNAEEKEHLERVLNELRARFVQLAKLVQDSQTAEAGAVGTPPAAGGGAAPGIEVP